MRRRLIAVVFAVALGAAGFAALDYSYGPAGTYHDGSTYYDGVKKPSGTYYDASTYHDDIARPSGTYYDDMANRPSGTYFDE